MEWDGMGWGGMGWDGMGWDGMGWDGGSCLRYSVPSLAYSTLPYVIDRLVMRSVCFYLSGWMWIRGERGGGAG